MGYLTDQNIWQAVVRALRADAAFQAALAGGIHEEFAPEKTGYPLATYQVISTPNEDDWTGRVILAAFQLTVFAENQVVAGNLDQSVADLLDGAELDVVGHEALICRRLGGFRAADQDDRGVKISGVGGTYEVWTNQHATLTAAESFSLDAVLV